MSLALSLLSRPVRCAGEPDRVVTVAFAYQAVQGMQAGVVRLPGGKAQPHDPTRPVTSLKTAWKMVRDNAGVVGRWHDNRHTLVTELAESGAGDEVIMSIAGHVSRAMLSRYSHVRMEAKWRAQDEIAARQRAADKKRKKEAEQQHAAVAVEAVAV